MRIRQTPMSEASALMAITFVLFIVSFGLAIGDLARTVNSASIYAAMFMFPAWVLWLIAGQLFKDKPKPFRAIASVGVIGLVALGGVWLLWDSKVVSNSASPAETAQTLLLLALTLALSGVIASVLTYTVLTRPLKGVNTLVTAPLIKTNKKKRK